MAGRGTGTPNYFMCSVYRRERRDGTCFVDDKHVVKRTGKTRPNPSRNRTQRVLATEHQYRCSCGNVAWSRHMGVLDQPLEEK